MKLRNDSDGSMAWAHQVLDDARMGQPVSRRDIDRALYLTGDLTAHDDAFSPLVSGLMRGLTGDYDKVMD